jgi:hypothetical protein
MVVHGLSGFGLEVVEYVSGDQSGAEPAQSAVRSD